MFGKTAILNHAATNMLKSVFENIVNGKKGTDVPLITKLLFGTISTACKYVPTHVLFSARASLIYLDVWA